MEGCWYGECLRLGCETGTCGGEKLVKVETWVVREAKGSGLQDNADSGDEPVATVTVV